MSESYVTLRAELLGNAIKRGTMSVLNEYVFRDSTHCADGVTWKQRDAEQAELDKLLKAINERRDIEIVYTEEIANA